MLKYLSLLFFILLFSNEVNATQGCVDLTQEKIYTSFQNGQQYWRTSGATTATPGCIFVFTGAVCSIGANNANNGYLGDTADIQCPIDDYAGIMVALLGGLGYWFIRKRNTHQQAVCL